MVNRKHLDLLCRSLSGKWTEYDKAAIDNSLVDFDGAAIAKDFFREYGYRRLKCCICGCDFYDRTGCNPEPIIPITEDGDMPVCCHSCDYLFVLPARLGAVARD